MRSEWLILLGLTLSSCAAEVPGSRVSSLPYYDSKAFTPHWIAPDDVPADFHRVSDFSLTDQDGQEVTQADMDGKVTVVDYFFTTCSGICPMLTKNMAVVDAAFPEEAELLLLSHSATPEKDTVAVLREYADAKGVDSTRWHLLTGDRSLIYHLGREVYFVEEDMGEEKGEDDFLHTENLVLIDRQRHIRGVYNGLNQASIQQLNVDIQTLLDEAPGAAGL